MILAAVRATVRQRALWRPGQGVLLACSGGPDSTTLVHVVARLAEAQRLRLCVASVDHGLRPEAAGEVAAVGAFAGGLGLAFEALRVEVPSGPSLQAQARSARYDALLACARRRGLERVAVGHTLDDQAETVLERLLRGSGTRGLAAIDPARPDGVVRPLIDCTRADVHRYAAERALPTVEDPSNGDPSFLRVRLRQRLLPALAQEDPAISRHLAALADDARADREVLEELGRALLEAARCPEGLAAEPLRAGRTSPRRIALGLWLSELAGRPPSRATVEAVEALLRGRGEVRVGAGRRVVYRNGRLVAESYH